MKLSTKIAVPVLAASLAFAVGACKPIDKDPATLFSRSPV